MPLLTQARGLFITPTFFTEEEYDKGWRQAMDTIICDWGLTMARRGGRRARLPLRRERGRRRHRAGYLDLASGSAGTSRSPRMRGAAHGTSPTVPLAPSMRASDSRSYAGDLAAVGARDLGGVGLAVEGSLPPPSARGRR